MASVINKISSNSVEYAIASTAFATSTTAGGTAAKAAYIFGTSATSGFTLTQGVTVYVKFTNTCTVANPTLSINGCTAKAIKRNGVAIKSGELQANCVYAFLYTGSSASDTNGVWELVNGGPAVVIYTWADND